MDTRCGSRVFQASSARRTFCVAVAASNGGKGGRGCSIVDMAESPSGGFVAPAFQADECWFGERLGCSVRFFRAALSVVFEGRVQWLPLYALTHPDFALRSKKLRIIESGGGDFNLARSVRGLVADRSSTDAAKRAHHGWRGSETRE